MNQQLLLVACFCLTLIVPTLPLKADEAVRSTDTSSIKFLIPAYFYPSGEGLASWNRLIKSQSIERKIEIVVIANINSGNVGTVVDPHYADVIRRAAKKGLKVIAYIASDYANRNGRSSLESAKTNVTNWFRLYPELHGIFVDEQTSDALAIDSYYLPLRRQIDSVKPKAFVVGNPGNNCVEDFVRERPNGPIMDLVVIHENNQLTVPYESVAPAAWMAAYPTNRFAMLVHTSSTFLPQLNLARTNRTGYVFVTDRVGPPPDTVHPWGELPTYWSDEVQQVSELNGHAP